MDVCLRDRPPPAWRFFAGIHDDGEGHAPPTFAPSVVVGIDGSDAAIAAAIWATDEAIARNVPLRLIHAADVAAAHPRGDFRTQITAAEPLFRAVETAVAATGKMVKVETAVVGAGPRPGLISESRSAEMLCVGSVGVMRAGDVLGSTAAALANVAFCPVAIIRPDVTPAAAGGGWIAVSIDSSPDSDPSSIAGSPKLGCATLRYWR